MNGTPARSTAASARSTSADVEADRLLAEDRLARLGGPDDEVDVGVAGRADGHGIDVRRLDELVDGERPTPAARRPRPPRRRRRHRPPRPPAPAGSAGPGSMRASGRCDRRLRCPSGCSSCARAYRRHLRLRARVGAPVERPSQGRLLAECSAVGLALASRAWRSGCRVRGRPRSPCASWSTGTGTTSRSSSRSAARAPRS